MKRLTPAQKERHAREVEELYQDVYVRSPHIHTKGADKDPAWRAAVAEDRVPEEFPSWAQQPAPAKVEG